MGNIVNRSELVLRKSYEYDKISPSKKKGETLQRLANCVDQNHLPPVKILLCYKVIVNPRKLSVKSVNCEQ